MDLWLPVHSLGPAQLAVETLHNGFIALVLDLKKTLTETKMIILALRPDT